MNMAAVYPVMLRRLFVFILLFSLSCVPGAADESIPPLDDSGFEEAVRSLPGQLQVFNLDPDVLKLVKERIAGGDEGLQAALKSLLKRADAMLKAEPVSVTEKTFMPPSGDKRDYMSLGIYWWPNPLTTIPYIHRDGRVNPEYKNYDLPRIGKFCSTVHTLGLAYYFTGEKRYAAQAARWMRTWFLDKDKRMNPNMKYTQCIPGISPGNYFGILEAQKIAMQVVDAIGMIRDSGEWTDADHDGVERWIRDFLKWLQNHPLGRTEAIQPTNHGSWYDVQIVGYLLFLKEYDKARAVLSTQTARRIVNQIKPDGSQPEELWRTKSFDYSFYNHHAHQSLAIMADRLGLDLWNYTGPEGQGIRAALEYLLPYMDLEKEWPYEQIYPRTKGKYFPHLRRAAWGFEDERYEELIKTIPGNHARRRMNLLWPPYPGEGGK